MDSKAIKTMLKIGETIEEEFKRCGNEIENDVYETAGVFECDAVRRGQQ